MIQAVLWDNDGVLVDSETIFYEITRSAFIRLGLNLTKEIWGTQYLGEVRGTREIAFSLGANPTDIDSIIDERNEYYRIALRQPPAIRPQVSETLEALAGRLRMGIVTGSHREQLHLMHKSSGLLDFFDAIITGDDSERTGSERTGSALELGHI
ncbi:HAD family hydrolase [Thermodesulfobacteriota bacterium]